VRAFIAWGGRFDGDQPVSLLVKKLSFEIEEPTGPGHSAAMASVTILDNSSGVPATVATSGPSTTPQGPGNVTLTVTVPQVKLWSPENRSLYTAVVTLYNTPTAAAAPSPTQRIDSATTRFGVRSIAVDGHKLMLNGQRVFLAGYGDDSIYPDTVSPPRTKAPYEEKLRFAHWHGFNFVRHRE
jgi:beta-galactosidase/beta-glucuronidase